MTRLKWKLLQVWLESSSADPNCEVQCGPTFAYMFYDGNPFCANDATGDDRWRIVDFTQFARITDPTITVSCN